MNISVRCVPKLNVGYNGDIHSNIRSIFVKSLEIIFHKIVSSFTIWQVFKINEKNIYSRKFIIFYRAFLIYFILKQKLIRRLLMHAYRHIVEKILQDIYLFMLQLCSSSIFYYKNRLNATGAPNGSPYFAP